MRLRLSHAAGQGAPSRPTVSLEAGAAAPGGARCPACGEPLFVWVETEGWGPREDQIVDRCENCGLVVARDVGAERRAAVAQLLGACAAAAATSIRAPNAASLQAWLGAENWAALRPGDGALMSLARGRPSCCCASAASGELASATCAAAGMASMWQTLLNLAHLPPRLRLRGPSSGRLRPGGRAAGAPPTRST